MKRTNNNLDLSHRTTAAPATGMRQGMVLVIVLVVISVLSLAAYTFCDLMVTQKQATNLSTQQIQTRWLVDAGMDYVRSYLTQPTDIQSDDGGPSGHYDNPNAFQAIPVIPDLNPSPDSRFTHSGNFTILANRINDDGNLDGIRYGLEDESTRLNINILLAADKVLPNGGRTLLMALPGMDMIEDPESIADAIMDWIDEDDEPREFGAEFDYYQTLQPPYAPKNGPLETVEELLLVRGMTPQLLFGSDLNRNGLLDEASATGSAGMANPLSMGSGAVGMGGSIATDPTTSGIMDATPLDRGWAGYLTLHSKEKNVNAEGEPRIYLNSDDLNQLQEDLKNVLGNETANFIIAYRQASEDYDGDQDGISASEVKLDLNQAPKRAINQVLDLIGKQVSATSNGRTEVLSCPFKEENILEYITKLMDNVTVNESPFIPGRININQAPRSILMGIPGMNEDIVEQIISQRQLEPAPDDTSQQHETWLMTSLIVTLDEMKQLIPFITTGGDVHRAQIVGYYEDGGATSRAEVIFDATGEIPRIVFWRDISHLGKGYTMDQLGVTDAMGGMGGTGGIAPPVVPTN